MLGSALTTPPRLSIGHLQYAVLSPFQGTLKVKHDTQSRHPSEALIDGHDGVGTVRGLIVEETAPVCSGSHPSCLQNLLITCTH